MSDIRNKDQARFSPDKLLSAFNGSNFIKFIILAIVLHVVFIGALSVNYLLDIMIPSRVERREEAAKNLKEQELKEAEKLAAAKAGTNAIAAKTSTAGSNAVTKAAAGGSNAVPDAGDKGNTNLSNVNTNSAIYKQATEPAKPEDIPKQPDDLGISISDTNVK